MITTRIVRIIPTDWKNWISLRAEVLGCYHPYKPRPEEPQPTENVLEFTFVPTPPPMIFLCPDPMEMETDLLEGAHIDTSSCAANSEAEFIRLNTQAHRGKSGGWVPEVGDLHPVVVAEFAEESWLTAVHLQGREDEEHWVKTLRIISSKDNQTWSPVFGPDGKEIIEGNTDQNSIIGHYFKKPVAARFVKVIPESWHKWPSFRMGLRGCHHPEILLPTRGPEVPVPLCPEMPSDFATKCPAGCEPGFLCDGEKCVDPADCSCFHTGRKYQVGDKIEADKCSHCVCALGGHSICTRGTCPPCKKDELSILGEECDCICEKCKEDQVLCKSNKVCILKEHWCNGVIDCPDDEVDCKEEPYIIYTETVRPAYGLPPTPKSLVTEIEEFIPKLTNQENATCDIIGKHIRTLDGQEINYDICHHVALKDIRNETFNITVHKECDYNKDCYQWLQVDIADNKVKVTSDMKVEFNGHPYTASQLVLLNKNPYLNITVEKVGDQMMVRLVNKGVTVTYDVRAHLSIETSPHLMKSVSGLCGFYSDTPDDDQQKPDGKQAYTSQDFGDSWTSSEGDNGCSPVICPHETMTKALEHCSKLRNEPFSSCAEVLPVDQFIELCMSSTCECILHKKNMTEKKCTCDAFQTFVQACEAKLGPMTVRNWRLRHECVPDCPPGMEWNDCGPSCQLTCDSTSATDFEECNGKCVSGCFCPPGTILDGDVCIPPDHCSDKVCQGFGDPHLQTYDGLFFPFQAIGTFLISSDFENSFVVEGLTKRCHFFTSTTCLVGLEITYKEQHVYIKKGHNVKLNGKEIPMEKLPIHTNNLIILGYPVRTFVVAIPQLNIEARYYEENAGFAVKVPSRKYFNKTVGLCGNCNGKKDDEMNERPVSEFVCGWLKDGSKEDCEQSFIELPEVKERVDICEKLKDEIFQPCHLLVDAEIFVDACSFDAVHSGDLKGSFCKTAMEYSRQCCQAGVVIGGWPTEYDCEFGCPKELQYHPCHIGCPQTCQNRINNTDTSICENVKVDGCFCPDNKIWKEDSCVESIFCETCEAEDHNPGDVWYEEPCRKCQCSENLRTVCMLEVCPAKPICSSGQTLMKLNSDSEQSCCESYTCVETTKTGCPAFVIPTCSKGEAVKLQITKSTCPKYACECDRGLCPDVVWPQDLEGGQVAESLLKGCCPEIHVFCDAGSCPKKPVCANGLELVEIEGECCIIYKCKPPKDVCIYTHLYKVVEGFEVPLESYETEPKTYKPNDVWHDGVCENCSCVNNHGQLVPFCLKEQCISLKNMPENKNYELHEFKLPGKCCPDIFQVLCKDDAGTVYEAGEVWQDEENPCITYSCEQTLNGDVHKVKNVINCTKCSKAAEYIPPSKRLGQCCGFCRPSKCEDGNDLYGIEQTWSPKGNPCLVAQCLNEAGRLQVVYTKQPCPVIPKDCPKDKIIQDESKCCEICNVTSEISCSSAPIPPEDTVGFFTFKDAFHGGVCINENPIPNVLKCSGACHSESYYSLDDGTFKNACKCCKVNITINRTVELRCPDGSMIHKKFLQPETCQCSKCAPDEATTKKPWGKPERIKGGFNPQQERWGQIPEENKGFSQEQEETGFGSFQQEPLEFEKLGKAKETSSAFGQEPVEFELLGQKPESHAFQQESIGLERFGQEPEKDTFERFGQEPEKDAFEKFGQEPEKDTFERFGQEPEKDTFERFGQAPEKDTFERFGQEPEKDTFERFGQEPEMDTFEKFGQEPESHA